MTKKISVQPSVDGVISVRVYTDTGRVFKTYELSLDEAISTVTFLMELFHAETTPSAEASNAKAK